MSDLLINPISKNKISLFLADLPQALIITGPTGIGLSTISSFIANEISTDVITILTEKDDKVDLEKGIIGVDIIRRLYSQTKSIHNRKQIFVIDCAEKMSQQAQNAFLKLLEEPCNNIHFILATHEPEQLIPTVRSRAQLLDIIPITKQQSEILLDQLNVLDSKRRIQMLFMASGLPAELVRLSADMDYFNVRSNIMRDARDILQASKYQRLLVANKYKDNRQGAVTLIIDACKILSHSISTSPSEELISQIERLLMAQQQIQANGNIRLCLARLVL